MSVAAWEPTPLDPVGGPTPAERHYIAKLLAWPQGGALLIGPDNNPTGRKSIDQAVEDGDCFCVVPRAGYLAVDFDHPRDGLGTAMELEGKLRKLGIRSVLAMSGGEGHRCHLWAYVPEALWGKAIEITRHEDFADQVLQVRLGNNRMRLPGFKHRSGRNMELVSHHTWAEAIEALRPDRHDPRPRQEPRQEPRRERPATQTTGQAPYVAPGTALESRFRNGWERGQRSGGLLKLAAECQRQGWQGQDFVATVLDHRNGAGQKPWEKRNPAAWLIKHVWEVADPWKTGHPQEFLDQIEQLRRQADAWQPPKRRIGVKTTLHKIIDLAEKTGKIELSISVRELPTLTGTGDATAHRHIKTLLESGLMVLTKRGNSIKANTYRLETLALNEYTLSDTPLETPGGVNGCTRYLQEKREAIHGPGLYRWNLPRAVLTVLLSGPADAKRIAAALGRRTSQVKDALAILLEAELVEVSGDVYTETVTKEKTELLAKERGHSGRLTEKKSDYQRHLEGYRVEMTRRKAPPKLRAFWDKELREITHSRKPEAPMRA